MANWDKEKTKEVYSKLCLKYGGKAITKSIMCEEGYSTLPSLIIKFYNGKEHLDNELGYKPFLTKWDINRTFETYKMICEKHGGPVGTKIINQEGYYTLPTKIIEYYGCKEQLDILLGYKATKIYWTKEKTKEIYSKLCEEKNGSVSQKIMTEAGYSTLPQKIIEYWGLKQNLDIELGYEPTQRTWTKEYVKQTYHKLCLQNGDNPVSQRECGSVSGLISAILTHYQSKLILDEELGYSPMRIKWTKDRVVDEYRKLCEANNGKSAKSRGKGIDGSLNGQIIKYFGSKENLDVELGYKPKRRNWTRDRVIEDYKILCEKNGGKAFSFGNDIENKHLLHAIGRHFGSKLKLDEMLGYKTLRTNWTKKMVKEKYHEICLANGNKPISGDVLIELGHNDLVTAIGRKYKKRNLDAELGYESSMNWDKDLVFKTYKELCKKHGDRPLSQTELCLLGFGKLIPAIQVYCGSKTKLDVELGYKPYKLFVLSNGAIVRSTYEVMFGNFLIKNNINFLTDKVIDKNSIERYRYDFLIKDVNGNDSYFEIWGNDYRTEYAKFKNYCETRNLKINFYKKLKLNLIEIESDIFKNKQQFKIIESLKKILVENDIKLDDFVELTADELIESTNTRLWNKEKVEEVYHKLCIENGDKPVTITQLSDTNRSDLIHAIRDYWVSKRLIDIHLGYEPSYTEWTKELIIEKALDLCCKNNLDFLSSDFIRENVKGLDGAIYKLFNSRQEFHDEYKKQLKK
jgi:hypothetical protein